MSGDVYMSESLPARESAARLLVCDDSPIERQALTQFLTQLGHAVDQVSDGKTAIAHVKQRHVDLVLLDLRMAGGDGFSVLSYLQEHHAALPVILLSGMGVDEIQEKMHTLYKPVLPPLLIKPVDPDQLASLVALQLSGQLPTTDAFA